MRIFLMLLILLGVDNVTVNLILDNNSNSKVPQIGIFMMRATDGLVD